MLEILKSIGLEESEAKLYLALLDLGESTVSHVTARAGVTRTLGYHILRKLESLGLVKRLRSESGGLIDSGKQMYRSLHPQNLLALAEKKQSETARTVRDLQLHLPDFLSLYSIDERFSLETFHGLDACRAEYTDFYTNNPQTLSILDASSLAVFGAFDLWWNLYISRIGLDTADNLLVADNEAGRKWIASLEPDKFGIDNKWMKQTAKENILFGGQLILAEAEVLILYEDQQELAIVHIRHAQLVRMLRDMFKLLWALA
ncbi:MAG: hypothetical protein HYY51_02535 [Candidatus Magasanikbacteria bacterium]|nr:hypothetical protein [Candidatus Magasanikbacteria bacterium]